MLLQTTTRKVILAIIAVLLLVTTVKDWYDFAQCGAVDQCIASALGLQLYTKSAISFLVGVDVVDVRTDQGKKPPINVRDWQ